MAFKPKGMLSSGGDSSYDPLGSYGNNLERTNRIEPSMKLGIISAGDEGKVLISGKTPTIAQAESKGVGDLVKNHIISVTVEEDVEMASCIKVKITDPLGKLADSAILTRGTILDFSAGYEGNTIFMDRFDLVGAYPSFPRDGVPTMELKGYDGRQKMTLGDYLPRKREEQRFSKKREQGAVLPRRKRNRGASSPPVSFKGWPDWHIIEEIAGYFGFAADTDETDGRNRNRVKKKGISYWAFILNIARSNNYSAWVDWRADESGKEGWVLHFKKKQGKFKDGYILEYGNSSKKTDRSNVFLEARISLDLPSQVTDVEVSYFDRKLVKLGRRAVVTPLIDLKEKRYLRDANGVIRTNREDVDHFGSRVRFLLGGRVIEAINEIPFKTEKEAQQFALSWLLKREEDFSICEGTLIGIENLKPRQIHKLLGLGNTFSGNYYFTQVRHKFSATAAYLTEFVAYRVIEEDPTIVTKFSTHRATGVAPKAFNFGEAVIGGIGTRFKVNGVRF